MSNASYPQPYPPRVVTPSPYPPLQIPPRRRFSLKILLTCLGLIGIMAFCGLFTLGGTFVIAFLRSQPMSMSDPPTPLPTPTIAPTIPPLRVYTIVGKPTLDVAFINSVLDYYGSPAAGKGQALYDDGMKYGINPAYALAFFLEESNFGTKGVATTTHALGNIRASTGTPQYQGYRSYNTWEAGFEDWYQLMANKYVGEWHLMTVDQIIPVYAPNSDNNNEAQYIQTIKIAIERWRNGYVNISD
jgi:hypothetical protein